MGLMSSSAQEFGRGLVCCNGLQQQLLPRLVRGRERGVVIVLSRGCVCVHVRIDVYTTHRAA